jgi:para-aminobenzoate synthetase/4-amino-4-deoxychorismate lyase
VRAVRVPLECALTPEEAVLHLRGAVRPFALVGEWAGVEAILGCAPSRSAADPFAALAAGPSYEPGDAVVGGGWFGVLGYRLGGAIERLPPSPPAPVELPESSLWWYDDVVVFDGSRWWLEALDEAALARALPAWRARLAEVPAALPFAVGPFAARGAGEAGHLDAVAECVERIAAGEIFQANLALRLEASFDGDALNLFADALSRVRPRFAACFEGVVSLSPERFLRRVGRHVETEPIKGTSPDRDALAASEKDAAEHVMIVDLMRNDLGRVCAYGSITAGAPRLEPFAGVWHKVTTVSGELRDDATDADLLRATFPPGSVTGAPKVQAMKVIGELEGTRREAYTGAIGYVSPVAGLELNVAIRTFEIAGGRIWLGVGGGIVADSTPEAELREALDKAAGPLAALGSGIEWRVKPHSAAQPSTRRVGRALEHGERPDPRAGLLETILVRDGEAQHLDAHLARLAASAAELYDLELPAELARSVAASAHGTGRLRVVLEPSGEHRVDLAPLGDPPEQRTLTPFVLPGGLGRHKWADRTLVQALAAAAPRTTPLLIDADGAVLEATWANVFLAEDGELITPPADGRILPGIHRAQIQAREETITLERLQQADEVFLTSALRRADYSPSSALYSRA